MAMNGLGHYIVAKVGKVGTVDKEPFIGRARPQIVHQVTERYIQGVTPGGEVIRIAFCYRCIGNIAI